MANAPKGGRRLAGSNPAQNFQQNPSGQFNYTPPVDTGAQGVDDALIDDILRSIAGVDFNVTAAPSHTLQEPPKRAALPRSRVNPNQPPQEEPVQSQPEARSVQQDPAPAQTLADRRAQNTYAPVDAQNEYQAAATSYAQQQAQQPYQPPQQEEAQNMRDPSQTQVFRPARPARRDTDRLPTLVDEDPKKKHPVLNKLLTFIVVVLILVALTLGLRMVYILGPSLGWNLPDLSKVPVISHVLGVIPDAEEQPITMPEEAQTGVESLDAQAVEPTSVTLDADRLTLNEGEKKVLTATLDVENWGGLLAWASSDKNEKVIRLSVLGPYTAQVEYVGEGTCAVAVQVGIKPADGSDAPHATCYIECKAAEKQEEATEEVTEEAEGSAQEGEQQESTGEHLELKMKKEDFTLNLGESYRVMDDMGDQVTWSSSNESVATVSNGVVAAVGSGTATITATGPDGASVSAVCRVR